MRSALYMGQFSYAPIFSVTVHISFYIPYIPSDKKTPLKTLEEGGRIRRYKTREKSLMHTFSQINSSVVACTFARPQSFGCLSMRSPKTTGLYCRQSRRRRVAERSFFFQVDRGQKFKILMLGDV